jgi:hypothetical protein
MLVACGGSEGALRIDVHARLDTVLKLDHRRREHFGELLGYIWMPGGRFESRDQFGGELTCTVDRAATRVLAARRRDRRGRCATYTSRRC